MKLRRLEIENYGIFSGNRTFEFSDGGFQLVHGPNEAGKSTLLQLIREVFFGFGTKNRYAFADHQGEMAATASIELSDGRAVTFRRRKGKKNVVVGQVEDANISVDEAALGKMLGQANAHLYQHVFGFSLTELVAGEKSLKDANINEALYGGGMGGLANFQDVQAALKKEHEGLFKSRGSTLTINKLLKSIKDAGTVVGKATVKPRDYKELCRRHDEAEAALDEWRDVRDERKLRFSRTERLHKALPAWLRRSEAVKELAGLDVADGILNVHDAEKDYRQTLAAIDAAAGELAQEQGQIESARAGLEDLRLEPRLTEETAVATVKSLERGLEQIERFREDLPKRRQEAAAIRYALGETVARLNPDWDIGFLEEFTVTSSQSEDVGSLAQNIRDLQRDEKNLETQIKEKNRKLAAETGRLNDLQATPVTPVLAQLSENAAEYKTDLRNLSETDTAIAEAALKIDDLQRSLAGAVELDAEQLHKLSVPLEAKINEFAARFRENHNRLAQSKANMEAAQTDLSDYNHRLNADIAQQKIPDRQILVETRRRRDTDWELIRRAFMDKQDSNDEAAKTEMAEKFERALSEADELADQRQDKAELVAAREQLAANTQRAENKLRELEKIHEDHKAETAALETQWRELWAQCRFEPDTPEVMRQWLAMHEDYFERLHAQKGLERKCEDLR
ncbi:MAG: AAA family ATPase, partial [Planctomycetota bacterium]|nr:AAA family ATPase [Planctomycetota bacterium]